MKMTAWCAPLALSAAILLPFNAQAVDSGEIAAALQGLTDEQKKELAKAAIKNKGLDSVLTQEDQAAAAQPAPVVVVPREVSPKDSTGVEPGANQALEPDVFKVTTQLPPLFGYELFAGSPSTFAPVTEIPVSADYVLGPGDVLQVQLIGKQNDDYRLAVTRDGALLFPELGPIQVAGMKFDAVQKLLLDKIANEMIGVRASITMGALRSIRIFVLGDAFKPGSYTVSSLSTVTNALFVSGGIKQSGSLRTVQLKRAGRVITTLDLYDLLLKGDTSGDARLQPGDVVFIPPIGKTVSVSGEVNRPATYELRGSASVEDALKIAGGLTPTAYAQDAILERINGQTDRTVASLDLTSAAANRMAVRAGDHLRVYSVFERADKVVMLSGAFERPRLLQWQEGMRLADAIAGPRELESQADTRYVFIRREIGPERRVEVLIADPSQAWSDPGSETANPFLHNRDQLIAMPGRDTRDKVLGNLTQELKKQARSGQDALLIEISGQIHSPGLYPLTRDMRLAGLIGAAGGGLDSAYMKAVELNRYAVSDGQKRGLQRMTLDLTDPVQAQTRLLPYDTVHVRPIEGWSKLESVTLSGEVKLPGSYVIGPNETIESVILRAGGFTKDAYLPGAVFTRSDIRERQQEELRRQAQRLKGELMQLQLDYRNSDKAPANLDLAQIQQLGALLGEELVAAQALGRIVVDLDAAASGRQPVALRSGDKIHVPRQPSEVTVLGEVHYPSSHLFSARSSLRDYVEKSGGFSKRADDDSAFVVHANGDVRKLSNVREAQPGDIVVVPFEVDRGRGLFVMRTIIEIISNVALTAASFKTLGAF